MDILDWHICMILKILVVLNKILSKDKELIKLANKLRVKIILNEK